MYIDWIKGCVAICVIAFALITIFIPANRLRDKANGADRIASTRGFQNEPWSESVPRQMGYVEYDWDGTRGIPGFGALPLLKRAATP